jgi:hypothetical protein
MLLPDCSGQGEKENKLKLAKVMIKYNINSKPVSNLGIGQYQ